MSMSKIVVSGRVVRAPEKRFTPSTNMAVTEFSIAVESAPKPDGSVETAVVKVITWRDLAERCAQEVKKGDLVTVDGRLQVNNSTSADGQRRRDIEVDAVAVENVSALMGGSQVSQDVEPRLAAAGVRTGKPKSTAAANRDDDIDAIFASEDEIPF